MIETPLVVTRDNYPAKPAGTAVEIAGDTAIEEVVDPLILSLIDKVRASYDRVAVVYAELHALTPIQSAYRREIADLKREIITYLDAMSGHPKFPRSRMAWYHEFRDKVRNIRG